MSISHRLLEVVVGTAVVGMLSGGVSAAITAADGFAIGGGQYNVGNLSGQNPTVAGFTGAWTGDAWQVVSGNLEYGDPLYLPVAGDGRVQSNWSNASRFVDTPVTAGSTGTFYLSFLMQSSTTDAGYRVFVLRSGPNDPDRNVVVNATNDGNITAAVRSAPGGSNTTLILGSSNTNVNLVVARFDLSSNPAEDSVTVWLNPDLSSPGAGQTVSNVSMVFNQMSIESRTGGTPIMSFDSIRFAPTWDAMVVPETGFAGADWLGRSDPAAPAAAVSFVESLVCGFGIGAGAADVWGSSV